MRLQNRWTHSSAHLLLFYDITKIYIYQGFYHLFMNFKHIPMSLQNRCTHNLALLVFIYDIIKQLRVFIRGSLPTVVRNP